ncbi:MAG: glucose-6-phosphate isomerase [Alphaproteobacteria bacterium]|nr:glucose-6-phosphate isomerase [Alphaproteobacteria bacterium]
MTLKQSIERARPQDFNAVLARTQPALARLRERHADGSLALLRLPDKRNDIATILGYGTLLREGATDVVFLGTGGSSLGGQTLAQLAGHAVPGVGALRDPPRVHFIDNLDPETFATLLRRLPLNTSRFAVISKSGGTGETLMQAIAALDAVKAAGLDPHDRFLGITEPASTGRANGLRDLLAAHKIAMMDHDPSVGGRYSVLTNVGLLPAAVCGLDIGAIRTGAGKALAPVFTGLPPSDVPAAVGAALAVALAPAKPISVMMGYADRLERFSRWYVQLWAESLGKDGKGTTPLAALGPVDQHSQLQLFIAGPRDKLFTILTVESAGRGPRIDPDLARRAGEAGFAGKTMGDLVAAQGRATAETLARNGCPVRTIEIGRLDEAAMGELLMHFMLETIIAAHLLGVDPFDQPAVEEGKMLAKRYLAGAF